MPLVVRELIIRATVEQGAQPGAGGAEAPSQGDGKKERQAIVTECVDQVLEILADREAG